MDAQWNHVEGTAPAHPDGGDHVVNDDTIAAILRPYPKGSGSASTPYQRDIVVQALSDMQRDVLAGDARVDAEAIKSALKLALYNAGATSAAQIVDNEQKVVDFVGRIFQTIFNDELLSESIKVLLSKLQVPVIKLALLDFEFFQNAGHPARRLLNGLVDLSVGVAGAGEPLFMKLTGIVKYIVERFESDIRPLEIAFQDLLRLRETEAAEIGRTEARFQREARIEARRLAAKRKVVNALNRCMQNGQPPEEVTSFILKCWAPYMAQTHIRLGISSEAWHAALATLRQLVKAAGPQEPAANASPFAAPVGVYFDRLKATLEHAHCYRDAHAALLQRARDWFAQRYPDQAGAAGLVDAMDTSTPAVKPPMDEEPEAVQTHSRLRRLLSGVPPEVKAGAWFEIYRGEGKAKRRLKLSAVLEDIGRLLFADRSGRGVLEIELEGFLQDLSAARTTLINDDNRFDQALSLVINTIRSNQARQEEVPLSV